LLNLQWVLEQGYRARAAQMGYKGIKAHNFKIFQTLLRSANVEVSEKEVEGAKAFDLYKMTYYPWWSCKVDGRSSPLIKVFVQKMAKTQKIVEDMQHAQWGQMVFKTKGSQRLLNEFRTGLRALKIG
jgi:hypothetical protein